MKSSSLHIGRRHEEHQGLDGDGNGLEVTVFHHTLVIVFMLIKAGFIVAIFMHAVWERLALVLTILGPPVVLLLLIGFMAVEGGYTEEARYTYMGHDRDAVALTPAEVHGEAGGHSEEEAH